MAKADIILRGRNYSIACAPGQEARIVALSQQLDARVKHIASAVGDIGEDRLLLITALALLVVLGLGIANLARTDDNQPSRSNKLMRMRIFIQAIVIALLVVIGFMAGAIRF
jgi:cell division protein ZapA